LSKEFKIGLLAIVAGAILYYGFNFLKGIDFFSRTNPYYIVYDYVDGLNKSNPVVINGLTVGKVSNIKLLQKPRNKVLVEITIESDIQLGDSTVAELTSDFLGGKSIVLKVGSLENVLEPRDTLNAFVDRGIAEYLDNVQPITNNLEITISRINEILLGLQGSGEKINNTIGELEITVRQVNEIMRMNKSELARTLQASRVLIENVNNKVQQLDPIINKSNTVLDSLANLQINETLVSVNVLLAQMTELLKEIDNGQGTLGKLANNDSLYNNLNQLLIDLDKTVIHFNQYPKDFLKPLGRKHEKLRGVEPKDP
jgi:phospholipid/cholesterol/gamma-HCH transport system substrate-binding protein